MTEVKHGTAISWTQAAGFKGETWNPVTGCDRISAGCAKCYAFDFAERWRGIPGHAYENGFDLTLRPERLEQPKRWAKPRMVFTNSMSDLFHEGIPDEFLASILGVIAQCPQHVFQVLTKRPERMAEFITELGKTTGVQRGFWGPWPIPNLWLGVSIENRRFVDRAEWLRRTPAALRFISAEPLLGPLLAGLECWQEVDEATGRVVRGWRRPSGAVLPELNLDGIGWLICGGESGPKRRRPPDLEWIEALHRVCVARGIAFFMKQDGALRPGQRGRIPDHLWVQEWPRVREPVASGALF